MIRSTQVRNLLLPKCRVFLQRRQQLGRQRSVLIEQLREFCLLVCAVDACIIERQPDERGRLGIAQNKVRDEFEKGHGPRIRPV